ncbi:cell wall teichoic acid glycosylation protein GtcA [Steroidobacter agaridevorans]|uniref:Cell wall teichoic acid glycosylation protein GtcA n=2 Tax=Steroidobacter agaridevorans TaxID=2695856 RepID=A0A829YAB6_9GAMM|nr:cell wall teichoic acid glycosylation protein GtcA [Steroidobacter agaridevorans]GFE90098.1 cell wall teichoic acid glycosylation protein GtcA [Steroidobacter agaridevorans]
MRFVFTGGASTVGQYIVLALLVEVAGMRPALASCIGYSFGAAVNYAMNRLWTFKTKLPHGQNLPRFMIMIAIGFLLSYALMHALVDGAGINYLLAQILTSGIVLLSNYLLAVSWVFQERTTD